MFVWAYTRIRYINTLVWKCTRYMAVNFRMDWNGRVPSADSSYLWIKKHLWNKSKLLNARTCWLISASLIQQLKSWGVHWHPQPAIGILRKIIAGSRNEEQKGTNCARSTEWEQKTPWMPTPSWAEWEFGWICSFPCHEIPSKPRASSSLSRSWKILPSFCSHQYSLVQAAV